MNDKQPNIVDAEVIEETVNENVLNNDGPQTVNPFLLNKLLQQMRRGKHSKQKGTKGAFGKCKYQNRK
jgi:hypothetical protein